MTTSHADARRRAAQRAHYVRDISFGERRLICCCGAQWEGGPEELRESLAAHRRDLGLSNPGYADVLGSGCRTAAERAGA